MGNELEQGYLKTRGPPTQERIHGWVPFYREWRREKIEER